MATAAETFRELERLYIEHPAKYRRKVALWVVFGYGFIFLILALIAAFLVGGFLVFVTGTVSPVFADNFIKAGIPLVIIAGLTTRAVFMRLPKPSGTYLDGTLKEKILSVFDDIRVRAKGRRIDEVVVTNELNAAVVQTPRFGLFGPTQNFLILGAPLLQLLATDEVRAVIAHEFGHLSHGHGRLGSIVYRLDQTLKRAASAIGEKNKGGLKNVSFRYLAWFYRHFDTVTFAMRRGQEYEADQVAGRATSPKALASALCRLNALAGPLNEFWSDVWRRSRDIAQSNAVSPQIELRPAVLEYATPELSAKLIDDALRNETSFSDSHPCLRERLEALAVAPVRRFDPAPSALDELLNENERQELLSFVDAEWQGLSAESWQRANEECRSAIAEMQKLRSRSDLDRQELLRLARLEENLEGIEASLGTHECLASAYPDDASIQFGFGRASFGGNREGAYRAFLKCLELDVSYFPDVSRYPPDDLPDDIRARLLDFEQHFRNARDKANRERESVSTDDDLTSVDLAEDFKRAIQEHAAGLPEIRRLFLVEKSVRHFQHDRVFLLGFEINTWHDNVEIDESKWLRRASANFAERFPGLNNPYSTLVTKKSRWADRLASIEGALVYEGSGKSKRTAWGKIKLAYWLMVLIAILVLVINRFL